MFASCRKENCRNKIGGEIEGEYQRYSHLNKAYFADARVKVHNNQYS